MDYRRLVCVCCGLYGGFVVLGPAQAAPAVFFDDVAGGRTSFDSQITSVGGTLFTDTLTALITGTNSWARPDLTITSTNSANRVVNTTYLAGGAPATYTGGGDGIQMTADGSTTSGLTFTFNSPINGFGVDLGDWATCCFPSAIFISFDGGAPIQVASATTNTDNPGVGAGDGARTFVAAIDDSATFTTITFYGTGAGDVLFAGGILRYGIVPIGALSGNYRTTAAPTPASGLATYLDGHDGSGDLATVATFLNTASEETVEESLKEIFPVNTSTASQTMMGAMGQTASVLIDKVGTVLGNMGSLPATSFAETGAEARLNKWLFAEGNSGASAWSGLGGGDTMAALAETPYQKFRNNDHALWVEGVGALSRGDSTDLSFGYKMASKGVVAGYEFALDGDNLVGMLGSVFDSDIHIDNDTGETDAKAWTVGLYGQHLMGSTKLSMVGLLGYGDYDGQRHVSVGGVNGDPQAEYNSKSASLTASASRLYEQDGMQMEPFVMANYTAVDTDGYSETGGGVYNMTVGGDKSSSAMAKIGVTFTRKTQWQDHPIDLRFKPYVGYRREIEEAGNAVRLAGTSPSSGTFIDGRNIDGLDTGLAFEAKLEFAPDHSAKFGLDVSQDKTEARVVSYIGYGYRF